MSPTKDKTQGDKGEFLEEAVRNENKIDSGEGTPDWKPTPELKAEQEKLNQDK